MQPVFQCRPVSLPSHGAPSMIPHPSITHVRFLVSLQRLPGIWSDRCAGAKRTHESLHHLPSIHRLKYRKHLSISISAVSKKVQPFVMDHSAHIRVPKHQHHKQRTTNCNCLNPEIRLHQLLLVK